MSAPNYLNMAQFKAVALPEDNYPVFHDGEPMKILARAAVMKAKPLRLR